MSNTIAYITSDDLWMAGSSINYWAKTSLIFNDDSLELLDRDVIAIKVTVVDENEDPRYHDRHFYLTLQQVNAAAGKAIDQRLASQWILDYFFHRDIDSNALDVAIQVACFGEVVYG